MTPVSLDDIYTETIKSPYETLYDSQTDRYIAVSWSHKITVVYEKRDSDILVNNGNIKQHA